MNQDLEKQLDALAARRDVHHAVMAVESGDGSLAWRGARGDARPGGPPMSPDTPFYIASIDKLFTATCIMMLHEAGRLSIDAPVPSLLPAALVERLHVMDGVDHTPRITARHLLSHTSGLADYLEDAPRRGRSWVETLVQDGDRAWGPAEPLDHVRQRLRPHFPPQPVERPRVRVRYSDTNYHLLNLIIAHATSQPLHRAYATMIFEPAGMTSSWVVGQAAPAGVPAPSALYVGDRPMEIPLALAALDGVYSTVLDLIAFMRHYTSGRFFRDAATGEEMRRRWNRFRLPTDRAALRSPSWPIEYGLGIKRFQLPRLFAGFRSVPTVYGHTGSTGTWLFHAPERDLFLCGAVDQVTAGAVPYRLVPKLLTMPRLGAAQGAAPQLTAPRQP